VNSVAHLWGTRRYDTDDSSRNNFLIALLTFGEGWHNNHHHFPGSAKQGFYWWEVDLTYYLLKMMSLFGFIWDIRTVSTDIRETNQIKKPISR
jgi:stearoyl-CoA desaturase (delta-9 desaturase)